MSDRSGRARHHRGQAHGNSGRGDQSHRPLPRPKAGDAPSVLPALRQYFPDHVAVDVGEAALDAVVIIGEPLVIEAKQVQGGGM